MLHVSGHCVAMQIRSKFLRAPRRWMPLLMLLCIALAWSGMARAVTPTGPRLCSDFNVPDSNTTPSTSPMAAGSTITIDAAACDGIGIGLGLTSSQMTQPAHGSAAITQAYGDNITYTNNGDGATSDSFTFLDINNNTINVTVAIVAAVSTFTVSPSSLPAPQIGSAYSQALSASGGTAPYSFALVSGSLPPGITFSGNTFSGAPTTYGGFTVGIKVTDSTGAIVNKSYSFSVAPPTFTFSALPSPSVGVPYSQTIQITGGTSPYTNFVLNSGSLPPGLSLSSSGVLSGTPTTANTYNFSIAATDSSSPTQYNPVHVYALTVNTASVPGAPTIGTATAGSAQANLTFTAPASDGGAAITGYTATSSPGGLPGSCASSPCTVTGLSNGTAYTFTVKATNSVGTGAASAASNSITPKASQTITFNNPGSQNFGTTPTLTASASSSLPVTFSSTTTAVCTVTSGGALTFITTGTCSIDANQAGNAGNLAAPQVAQSFSVAAVVPGAPAIGTATAGNAQASVTFSPPANDGGAAITQYAVITTTGGFSITNCSSSPCVVTGLINGTSYTFSAIAENSAGAGVASASSNSVTPLAAPTVAAKAVSTAYNTAASIDLSSSITGVGVTYITATQPLHGTTTVSGETVTYTPAPTYYGGSDSFTYTATNPGGTSAPATVTITVGNAPPSNLVYAPNVYFFTKGQSNATTPPTYAGSALTNCTVSPALPTGLSIDASNCTISGTPTTLSTTPIDYTVTASNPAGSTTATVTITVNDVAPSSLLYTPDSYTFTQGQAITTATPTYAGGALTSCMASPALPAGLTIDPTRCAISGTPTVSAPSSSYTVMASNSGGNTTATVTINVLPAVPTVANASITTAYNTAASIDLTSSITGADITGVTVGSGPSHGSTSVSGKTVTYTPAPNYYGIDSFTYTATNAGGTSAPATVSITVGPPAVPTVAAKSVSTAYNTVASIDLTSSISGVDITGIAIAMAPTHGAVSVSGKTVTYTPSSTYYGGADSFTYTATNPGGTSAPATVSITVGAPAAPTAHAKSVTTAYNTAASIDLTSSITGVDIAGIAIATAPAHGTISLAGMTATYTPSSTYYGGPDSFTYIAINSGGVSSPATVSITVGTPAAPTAHAKSVATPYNTAASIDLTSSISGVDITGIAIAMAPAHGTVSVSGKTVTYTPSSSYYGGSDSFAYTAINPSGTSAPATVSITVGVPAAPTAVAKSVSTAYNTAAAIDLTSSISGADITSIAIGAAPVHGTVSVSGKTVTYTPSSSYYGGSDSFTYTAINPGGTSALATVSITVGTPAAPTAAAKSISTAYNTAAVIDLSGSISGVDITAVTIGTMPAHGTVSVSGETVIYTPSSTYYGGSDSFTYTATNPGGTSAPATISLTVGLPPVPTVTARSVTTAYDTAASIDLSGAITGVDITSVAIASAPSHGTVSVSGKTVTYTPSSTFYGGNDSFTYTATNPGGTSAPATVTMKVTPLSVPTAQALAVTTTTGASVQIQATAGATGPAPFIGVSVAQTPAHGQATASGEQITYTPAAGFIGTDHFTYRVANHFGSSAATTVTVTVTAAGQASAPNGTVTLTTKPDTPVSTDLGHIVTGPFVSSSVLGLSPGGAGQVSINQPTTLTFTSVAGFHGVAQITVLLTAADGHTATVDVLVLVSNQPDPSKNPDVLGLINAQTMEAQRFADSQLGNIQQRLESVRDGNDRLFSSTLSLNQDGRSPQASGAATADNRLGRPASSDSNPYDPNGVAATAQPGPAVEGAERMMQSPDASSATSAPAAVQDDHVPPSRGSNGLGTWIDVSADFGSFDAYRQAAGFDADDIAISTGIDRRLGEYGLLGLSLGYNHDRSAIGNDGTRSTARGYSAALYGSFAPSAKTYIDAILGGGGLSFDSRRRASNSDRYLFGQRDGKQWFGSVTAGYEYRHEHWLLSPYGRLEWSYSNLDSFAESGDVVDALAYGRQSVRTSVAVLGVRTSWMVARGQTILIPRVRLEVGHNFQGTSDTTLNYAFVPSAGSWSVLTNPYSANGNSVLAGFGLDIQLPRDMTLTTDYNFLMQPHSRNQVIRLGLQTKF